MSRSSRQHADRLEAQGTAPSKPASVIGRTRPHLHPLGATRGVGEPQRETMSHQAANNRLAVTLTLGELRELIRAAALEAVAEATQDVRPALLDRIGLARALGVGTSTVDRFRRDGCPVLWVGDSPRFELEACMAWLRERGQP